MNRLAPLQPTKGWQDQAHLAASAFAIRPMNGHWNRSQAQTLPWNTNHFNVEKIQPSGLAPCHWPEVHPHAVVGGRSETGACHSEEPDQWILHQQTSDDDQRLKRSEGF
jgi:hypothetical protein